MWDRGCLDDGSDCVTRQIAPAEHWPVLRALLLVVCTYFNFLGNQCIHMCVCLYILLNISNKKMKVLCMKCVEQNESVVIAGYTLKVYIYMYIFYLENF